MKQIVYQIIVSCLIALVIAINAPAIARMWNGHAGLEKWFVVRQLEVDKFTKYGNYPIMYYDRTIIQDFSADWTATIQRISDDGTFSYFCSGFDHNDYKSGIGLPKEKLTVMWIVKNDPSCFNLKESPGAYRLVVSWTNIDRGPYYHKTKKEIITNIFKILDLGVEIDGNEVAN